MHPSSTIPSWKGFWGIETWVIRPHPSHRLHSAKRASCCDDATKSKFECRHTLEERLRESNLAWRGVTNLNPIMPSAVVGNLQRKIERMKVTQPIWNKTWCSPTISRLSPVTTKCSNVVLSSGTSPIPGCKRLQLDTEYTMRFRSTIWILTATIGSSNRWGKARFFYVQNKVSRVWSKSGLSRKGVNDCKSGASESAPVEPGITVPPLPPIRRFQCRV